MRKTLCLVLAVAVASVAAIAFAPSGRAVTEDEVADALFRKINNKRAKIHGLQRLDEWSVIVDEATGHSADQARRGQISHDGFQGRVNRIRDAGAGINGVCENVAFVRGVTALKDIVRIFYRGWDRSREHNACMFDELFNATWGGVGVVRTGDTWYATFIEAQDASPGRP